METSEASTANPSSEGFVIPESEVRSPRPRRVLFVCTGNTCRSPLAAAVCRVMLAARVGCSVDELPAHGFVVESAGVAALPGDPASAGAVDAARKLGADLSAHRSRLVTEGLLAAATDVLAMTHGHGAMLALRYPESAGRVRLLGGPGGELPDPFGGGAAVYEECAAVIVAHLERHLAEWLAP